MKVVTIFGSSLPAEGSAAYEDARRLGRLLAEGGFTVCNGGYSGLMEASARGAREAGGHTIGVTCAVWPAAANWFIVEEVRAGSFLERLTTLIERGDAYVVLPGGTGTLAELALVWEMMNMSALAQTVGGRKPLLVMAPYWQPVIDCLKQEGELNSKADWRAPAMGIVSMVFGPDEAALTRLGTELEAELLAEQAADARLRP
ncbi:MAG: LOG family protein, partial [Acidobacteriia bacterium]|nr:LOG family protein [Terriglobia bacterium]